MKIYSPFFNPDDLEILEIIKSIDNKCRVQVLSSIKGQKNSEPWEEHYKLFWNNYISEEDPPNTDIYIVGGINTGCLQINENWIMTDTSGLKLSAPFSTIGVENFSKIRIMNEQEFFMSKNEIEQFFRKDKRTLGDEKLKYYIFLMP